MIVSVRTVVMGAVLATIAAGGPVRAGETAEEARTIHSQPSWILANDDVELAVTKVGGHMAPVTFARKSAVPIRPYYVSPWQDEHLQNLPAAVLGPLRGDFFCMPFGGNDAPRGGERHVPHGETATAEWTFAGRSREPDGTETLTLTLDTKVRPGKVTKQLALEPGEPVIYCRHVIEGFAGPTPLGHHATLAMPTHERALAVSVSPFRLGMTAPGVFSDPAKGEYQALASGSRFTDLTSVPSLFKEPAAVDCSRFPVRRGYADLLAVVADDEALAGTPAWTAAVNTQDHWAWFALRDPAVLPTTVFWIENGGRHGLPWNGRNSCLGLEDVCAFFAEGLVPSIEPNLLSAAGIRTAVALDASRPTEIRSIQGAVRVPEDFGRIRTIRFEDRGIVLVPEAGPPVSVPVRHRFVMERTPSR